MLAQVTLEEIEEARTLLLSTCGDEPYPQPPQPRAKAAQQQPLHPILVAVMAAATVPPSRSSMSSCGFEGLSEGDELVVLPSGSTYGLPSGAAAYDKSMRLVHAASSSQLLLAGLADLDQGVEDAEVQDSLLEMLMGRRTCRPQVRVRG